MKKVLYVAMMLIVVLLPGIGHSQERPANGTVPYTVWLPVVRVPSVGEMYPECPYETTLASPEDGAERYWGAVTFEWETEAPQSQWQFRHLFFPDREWITSGNVHTAFKLDLPGHWRVRGVCDTENGMHYGPWSEMWVVYSRN